MKEKFISLETAKLAKEKGFNIIGNNYYTPDTGTLMESIWFVEDKMYHHGEIPAPTQSFLQQWLRDVHKIDLYIEPAWEDELVVYLPWVIDETMEDGEAEDTVYFDTYEEALEVALLEALSLIKVKKIFYRVCNTETLRGLWYNFAGEFTGIIHDDFDFCLNSSLKMDFDPELVGWLSATDNLEDLYKWFTKEDILRLQNFGWFIHEFEAEDYKFYERFQHIIIKQDTSKVIRKIEL